MNLTRKQIKLLGEGNEEIINLADEAKNKTSSGTNNFGNYFSKYKKTENNIDKSDNSFYQLFSLPGIKMTDKAKNKLIESKKRELNAGK